MQNTKKMIKHQQKKNCEQDFKRGRNYAESTVQKKNDCRYLELFYLYIFRNLKKKNIMVLCLV